MLVGSCAGSGTLGRQSAKKISWVVLICCLLYDVLCRRSSYSGHACHSCLYFCSCTPDRQGLYCSDVQYCVVTCLLLYHGDIPVLLCWACATQQSCFVRKGWHTNATRDCVMAVQQQLLLSSVLVSALCRVEAIRSVLQCCACWPYITRLHGCQKKGFACGKLGGTGSRKCCVGAQVA